MRRAGESAHAAVHRKGVRSARRVPEPFGRALGRNANVIEAAGGQQAAEEGAMRAEAAVLYEPRGDDLGRRPPGDGNLANASARDVERPVDYDLDRDAIVLQEHGAHTALPAVAAHDKGGAHRLPREPDGIGMGSERIDFVQAKSNGCLRHRAARGDV
jgi:hypothetical protein